MSKVSLNLLAIITLFPLLLNAGVCPGTFNVHTAADFNDSTGSSKTGHHSLVNIPPEPTIFIQSDGNWKASANLYPNWETKIYDDSGWGMNVSPSPGAGSTPNCWTTPTIVQSMWGQAGENVVYLRKKFTITNSQLNDMFLLEAACDDDMIVYVNGLAVIHDVNGSAGPLFNKIDISQYLSEGDNVIAVRATNTQCCSYGVCLRVFEYVSAPVNDQWETATTLTPSADNTFSATAGTITYARQNLNGVDCDYKPTSDVWYKFTATASYHRIVLKNATLPDSMRFQLFYMNDFGGGDFPFPLACVLNSHDSTVYDATDLIPGKTYWIKVYALSPFTEDGDFDIGVVTPQLDINKGRNLLTNGSFETPAMINQATNVGNSFNGWYTRQGHPMAILKDVGLLVFGPDTSSSGKQHVDMFGYNDTVYHAFTLSTTSTVFFSGHFSNQAAQYSLIYTPWTAFCGILDENDVLVARSDIMNFTNTLTDKPWYQLSGTVYNLPPGNYKYVAYVDDYGNFDNAFVQSNFNCVLQSQSPTSISSSDNDNIICSGSSITFTANGAVLASGANYAWYEGGCYDQALLSSSSSLTVIPSPGIHHYYVRIEESCGFTNCVEVVVNVHAALTINISSNYGNGPFSICPGTSVTYLANTSNAGTNPFYQWKLNGINVGTNSNIYTNNLPQNNDVVICEITNTTTGCTAMSNAITTLLIQNNAAVSISTASATVCENASATFTAISSNGGNSPYYNWKKNGVTVFSSYSNTFTTIIADGDVISCEMISSFGCFYHATSNSITMSVSPTVTPALSIAITAGTNPDCAAEPIVFTATPVNGGTMPSYQWLLNGNPAGTDAATFTLSSPSNNDVVSCVLTSNANCISSAYATSNSIVVKAIVPSPSVLIGWNNANPTCANGTIQFYAVYSDAGTSPSFQWKLNGNPVGSNSNVYTRTGFTDGDQVTVTITSSEPCAATASVESSPVTIYVYDVSSASLTISGPSFVCSGTEAVYYAQPVNAGPNPSLQWKKNGIVVGNGYSYSDNALQNNDVITCFVTTDPVCASPLAIESSNSITVIVSPTVTPTISITASNPVSFLQNSFSATITNGGTDPVYEWRKNAVVTGVNSSIYIDMALVPGDEITCTLYSNASCVTIGSVVSNRITVQSLTYCIPVSIIEYPACSNGWITNVQLGNSVNRTTGCDGYYADFSATDILTAATGETINYSITGGSDGTNYAAERKIYIDYNKDGDFNDAGELVAENLFQSVEQVSTGTFVIPQFLAPGNYRIRVLSDQSVTSACELYFGEAEDYSLLVTQPAYCIPVVSQPCDEWISNVSIGSINNVIPQPTDCNAGGFADYSSVLSTTASPGQQVDVSLLAGGIDYLHAWQIADVFVDYNNDGDFDDEGERVISDFVFSIYESAQTWFIVPSSQPYGYYRLRVKTYNYDSNVDVYTGACGNSTNGTVQDYTLIVQPASTTITLNLKLFLEGFYMGGGLLQPDLSNVEISTDPTEADTITVNLWNPANLSNADPDHSTKAVLHTDGTATMQFPAIVNGNSYYIAVKHRNHIETWSHDPLMFTGITSYDFTQSLNAAYDDGVNPPMKILVNGNYGIYAGDINQDGAVDGQDMNVIDNNVGFFGYDNSDINGDGATDGQDMNFVDNNSQLGLFFARPY
ncbi:MAG: GEVED domain-containing protein [Ferruginibacter sp.]